jgi:molybdopterin synthase sulfur carrier subunit
VTYEPESRYICTMSIEVRFFASLSEQLGTAATTLETPARSVAEVWSQATGRPTAPANTLCAINMEYARFDDAVNDGDEVAFFPPVTGGGI